MWETILAPIFSLIDKFVPDPKAAQEMKSQTLSFFQTLDLGQIAVNIAQAQSRNAYSAAARPTAMYMCIVGIFCATTVRWALSCFGIETPQMDVSTLVMLLTGMLGLGGYRMVEKLNGVAS